MNRNQIKGAVTLLAFAVVLIFSNCNDSSLAPFEPEVTNATDNFQMQATGVRNRTTTLTYSWENTGTRAKVNHSTTTTAGTARLVIEDSEGAQVYDETLVPSLDGSTTPGAVGEWTIRLELDHYSGTLNFRVEKL